MTGPLDQKLSANHQNCFKKLSTYMYHFRDRPIKCITYNNSLVQINFCARNNLGMGGWGPENGVRIVKIVHFIGRSCRPIVSQFYFLK